MTDFETYKRQTGALGRCWYWVATEYCGQGLMQPVGSERGPFATRHEAERDATATPRREIAR